jgi:pyruvate dehydrogenase E2 component (dihydrolipoamide acetyltransferase)
MEEGTLAGWLMKVGDTVNAGDGLADIETDKAIQTFESFDDGVLLHTFVGEGDTVPLGTPICILGGADEDISALVKTLEAAVKTALAGEVAEAPAPASAAPASAAPEATPTPTPTQAAAPSEPASTTSAAPVSSGAFTNLTDADGVRIKATPLARRIAEDRGVDLSTVAGSGPGGRIIKRDVENLDATRRVRAGAGAGIVTREDTHVRVTQMRKTIAKRLVESKQGAPHFYLTMTVDAGRLVSLRSELNASQDRVKLSYNDLIMRACVVALQDHPEVNAGWEGKTIRQFGGVHLGFAVAIEHGLITPVVRDADQKGLLEMAEEIRSLAGRARAMELSSEEYSGNSFCVSNLGMFGIDQFTAIINPPAACILAVGALSQQPVVVDDALVTGHRMTVTLSCDHRVVDGAMGAAFLADLREVLESPLRLLLA